MSIHSNDKQNLAKHRCMERRSRRGVLEAGRKNSGEASASKLHPRSLYCRKRRPGKPYCQKHNADCSVAEQ